MPTYEYACKACGHQWEQTQRISEPPVEVCPSCLKSEAHRLISAGTHFILKGGGWYSDLYASRKPAGSASESKEKGESKDTGENKGAKSEAGKPAAAPAPSGSSSSSADSAAKPASKPASSESSAPTTSTS